LTYVVRMNYGHKARCRTRGERGYYEEAPVHLKLKLREKTDRHGRKYLFGAAPVIQSVAFVYPLGRSRNGADVYELVIKPYTAGATADEHEPPPDEFGGAWSDPEAANPRAA
jgi:hypothetical protein